VRTVRDAEEWKIYLRRHLNFFYGCGAVHHIEIGAKGTPFYEWRIELCDGNDPQWLKPHLKPLLRRIQQRIQAGRKDGCVVERLIITAPHGKTIAHPQKSWRV